MGLRDHLLGDPDRLSPPALLRGLRFGSEPFVVRCARALAERPGVSGDALLPLLSSPSAATRRAAARALGALQAGRAALTTAMRVEQTEEGRLQLSVALARCGEDPAGLAADLARYDSRRLLTVTGWRAPSAAAGAAPLVDRFWLALGDHPGEIVALPALLGRRRAAARAPGAHADAIRGLAELGHPQDVPTLVASLLTAGRRGEHALLQALGTTGDPRAVPPLRRALSAIDVDPGRGFAWRRLAARGLGRLGLGVTLPPLLHALEAEAVDHEGRPGAGLGVQYPVRADLVWALGEIAHPGAIPALISHLGDTHGSALGGFHLPAMDALTKLGPPASGALQAAASTAPPIAAAHAVSVLAATGHDVGRWANDPRPEVRAVARGAIAPPDV